MATADQIIRNLRHMAWERAKGELQSLLHTYWDDDPACQALISEINCFVENIEDKGWIE